jgi:hypothetical protein
LTTLIVQIREINNDSPIVHNSVSYWYIDRMSF